MMLANDYQALASRTLIDAPEVSFTNEELAIMFAALELGAAVGKVLEYIKKGICHRHGYSHARMKELLESCEDASMTVKVRHLMKTPEYHLTGSEQMLIWCALGLGGEAGEVMDVIGNCPIDTDYTSVLVKELGDNDWYNAAICTLLGVPMSEVMQSNIDKLKKRFPDGWGTDASIARVDVQR